MKGLDTKENKYYLPTDDKPTYYPRPFNVVSKNTMRNIIDEQLLYEKLWMRDYQCYQLWPFYHRIFYDQKPPISDW